MLLPVQKNHTKQLREASLVPYSSTGALKGYIRIMEVHPGDMEAHHGDMEVSLEPGRPSGLYLQLLRIIMEERSGGPPSMVSLDLWWRLEVHSGKLEAQLGSKGFHPGAIKAQPGYFESNFEVCYIFINAIAEKCIS
jgi:hypothetical protein